MIPYGYVYLIRNKINNKTYIGIRKLSRDKYWREYLGSGKLIKDAISKYGPENFVKSLVSFHSNQEELIVAERNLIQKYKKDDRAEYNLALISPPPNMYRESSEDKRARWSKNLSSGIKKSYEGREHPSTAGARKRDVEFSIKYSENQIKSLYETEGSVRKLANKLEEPEKVVYRYLKMHNLLNASRTVVGYVKTDAEKLAVSNTLRRMNGLDEIDRLAQCVICSAKLHSKDRSVDKCRKCKTNYMIQNELNFLHDYAKKEVSIREISRVTGVSRRIIDKFMVAYGYKKST